VFANRQTAFSRNAARSLNALQVMPLHHQLHTGDCCNRINPVPPSPTKNILGDIDEI